MKTRVLPLLLTVTLASMVLAGCNRSNLPTGAASAAKSQALRAKGVAEEAMDFQKSCKKAIDLINTNPGWKNPKLVSIEGHGFDQNGKMVSLLGSYWVFKFWANPVDEEGQMGTNFERADVTMRIEGASLDEVVAGGEARTMELMRVLNPATLASPTQIVPFAIALGLKVNPAGPAFNYYDVTYNSFYANPSAAKTDVADVTSWYQQSTFDGLRIPARTELLPLAPTTKPAAAPVPGVSRLTPAELARETAERQHR
jgi:hypothetical protein